MTDLEQVEEKAWNVVSAMLGNSAITTVSDTNCVINTDTDTNTPDVNPLAISMTYYEQVEEESWNIASAILVGSDIIAASNTNYVINSDADKATNTNTNINNNSSSSTSTNTNTHSNDNDNNNTSENATLTPSTDHPILHNTRNTNNLTSVICRHSSGSFPLNGG